MWAVSGGSGYTKWASAVGLANCLQMYEPVHAAVAQEQATEPLGTGTFVDA